MAFPIDNDVFGKINNVTKLKMLQDARSMGEYPAAEKYYKEVGISKNGLYKRLRRELHKVEVNRPLAETMKNKGRSKPIPKIKEKLTTTPKEKRLTREESRFLKDLKDGKASLEEASRLVAVRVFDKMFRNPDNVKFLDFFRTELLKIKKMEAETKRTWGNQLLARMFGGGELPPPVCPHCKYELVEGGKKIMEGEIIGDVKSLSSSKNS